MFCVTQLLSLQHCVSHVLCVQCSMCGGVYSTVYSTCCVCSAVCAAVCTALCISRVVCTVQYVRRCVQHCVSHVLCVQCSMCGGVYSQRSALLRHLASRHHQAPDGAPLTTSLTCSHCPFTTLAKHLMTAHVSSRVCVYIYIYIHSI